MKCEKHSRIGGIFHLAMVLKDKSFENQSVELFKAVFQPKSSALKNLDKVSRMHCPELDYFVAFSSFSAGFGISGQTNYGATNSAMERLIEQRRHDGYPGIAIQWGLIGDVGGLIDAKGDNDTVLRGCLPLRIFNAFEIFDLILCLNRPIVSR